MRGLIETAPAGALRCVRVAGVEATLPHFWWRLCAFDSTNHLLLVESFLY